MLKSGVLGMLCIYTLNQVRIRNAGKSSSITRPLGNQTLRSSHPIPSHLIILIPSHYPLLISSQLNSSRLPNQHLNLSNQPNTLLNTRTLLGHDSDPGAQEVAQMGSEFWNVVLEEAGPEGGVL